jgi:putative transposase
MSGVRRRHTPGFKGKVALEALKQLKTTAQLSGEYGVHPNLIAQWKKKLKEGIPGIFSNNQNKKRKRQSWYKPNCIRKLVVYRSSQTG